MIIRQRTRASSSRLRSFRRGILSGEWTLPPTGCRERGIIPWSLPFRVSEAEARCAFETWRSSGRRPDPQLSVRHVRPVHLPYYIFTGRLEVTFKGVLGFGKTEYAAHGLRCSTELGPDEGAATAVYAGFDFRRRYVRETLSGDVSEALLESAVPFSQLADQPAGAGVESFKMKPSFAYAQRLCERLPGIALYEADRHLRTSAEARALRFEAADGSFVCPAGERPPCYVRAEEVKSGLEDARLHSHGALLLPLWAVEYVTHGLPFRAFVSALLPGDNPTVAGMSHVAPWEALAGWRAVGELRRREAKTNREWRVRRYWLNELERVMPQLERRDEGGRQRGLPCFGAPRQAADADDYALLGLCAEPSPTAAAVGAAFRALAMASHPDQQPGLSERERADVTRRFRRLLDAHGRLRRKHRADERGTS
mmetsp:Transcript_19838/g.65646  ORF Transcript_19838/g.65646 Transcript_19838/m.65646 type:complete len:425 (+) Transcript_19838:97-1371(+)